MSLAGGALARQVLSAALAALALLACDDDASSRPPVGDAGREAGVADAAATMAPSDAATGSPMDAALPDATEDAADDDDGATLRDAGRARDAPVDAAPRPRTSLVDPWAWTDVDEDHDAWNDRPADASCLPEGSGYEYFGAEDSYFVDTAQCAYKTASQPSLTEVRAGEEIAVRLWHFDLIGPDGAEAHIALRIGDRDLIDEWLPIPTKGELLSPRVVVDETIPADTPIVLHVHNHGANQYYLLELSTGPAEP